MGKVKRQSGGEANLVDIVFHAIDSNSLCRCVEHHPGRFIQVRRDIPACCCYPTLVRFLCELPGCVYMNIAVNVSRMMNESFSLNNNLIRRITQQIVYCQITSVYH